MSDVLPSVEQAKRRILFIPLKTKEALHAWIVEFLALDIPDTIVDPDSNSTPMDLLWEVYDALRTNERPDFSRVIGYASRDGFKTLTAAVLEVLAVVHLRRNVAHMAAIEAQSKKAQSYVKAFLSKPYLRDFITLDNDREKHITRYHDGRTGADLNEDQFKALSPPERHAYEKITNYIKIVICTPKGANCIDPESLVATPIGQRRASSIEPGNDVISYDARSGSFVAKSVKSVGYTLKNAMRVTLASGASMVCSEDHPILTRSGFRRPRGLRLGVRMPRPSREPRQDESTLVSVAEPCTNPRSALLGTLLGDSSLTWPRNRHREKYGCGPRFQVSHGSTQLDYLKRKVSVVERFGVRCGLVGRARFGVRKAMSAVSPAFAELYDLVYPDGKKRITPELLAQLDEESLAFWFMDDARGDACVVGSRKPHCLTLATCCFDAEENTLLRDWFRQRWGLVCRVGSVTNGRKRYPQLEFTLESSRRLSALLDRYLSPCVKYKFPAPSELLDTRCLDCGSALRRVRRQDRSPRCGDCPKPNSRTARRRHREFVDFCSDEVTKLEHLGLRYLVDLEIDTDDEMLRSFVVNGAFIVHNSEHVPFFVVDEVDLANPIAYEEAKMIPAPYGEQLPVTLLTSTRKYAFGIVQQEIDDAPETGIHIRHWNAIDVTERCPPSRHQPGLPIIDAYYSDETLDAITPEQYAELTPDKQKLYQADRAYAGCLKNCKLFAVCRGRLATKQKPANPKAKVRQLLKPVTHTQNLFKSVDIETAKAQLLCRKPSTAGLVYPNFDRLVHMLTPAQMAEQITGESFPLNFSKAQLMALLKAREVRFVSGMDFGYTHRFAVVTGAIDGNRCFVFDVVSIAEIELEQQIEACDAKIKDLNPRISADSAQPQSIRTFSKRGYRIKGAKKDAGSVLGGIEVVRMMLKPALGQPPRLFFLKGDEGCELLAKRLAQYHWLLDAKTGEPTDVPSDKDDDECDALRYLIMANFGKGGRVTAAQEVGRPGGQTPLHVDELQRPSWMSQAIRGALGESAAADRHSVIKGKKGGFSWSF